MSEEQADREAEALMSPRVTVEAISLAKSEDHVKCPRCWHYHTCKLNFDSLCDRCSTVVVDDFPDHPSVPFIKASREQQLKHYS